MSLASFFPRTVASRSPLSPILSQNVFRCLNIDGERLGYLVRLDLGVEADCALRRFAVLPVHLSSHLCRCRAVLQVTLPFFLAHTVWWVRKVSECSSSFAAPGSTQSKTSHFAKNWKVVFMAPSKTLVLHSLDVSWSAGLRLLRLLLLLSGL